MFERLAGSWALGSLLLAAVALGTLVTLLSGLWGMAFAQVTSAFLVAAVFVLDAFVPAFSGVIVWTTFFAQTVSGVLAVAALCALLVTVDMMVFKVRRR